MSAAKKKPKTYSQAELDEAAQQAAEAAEERGFAEGERRFKLGWEAAKLESFAWCAATTEKFVITPPVLAYVLPLVHARLRELGIDADNPKYRVKLAQLRTRELGEWVGDEWRVAK